MRVSPLPEMQLRPRPIGSLRPDIILYGEHQTDGEDIGRIVEYDLSKKPDMLIVMGTSLSIPSLKELVRRVAKEVKNQGGLCILLNRTQVASMSAWKGVFDYHVKGELDSWVEAIVAHWKEMRPSDWGMPTVHPNLIKYYSLLQEPVVPHRENPPDDYHVLQL
jgi:NAD-dependent histone deacetylase SIR2